MDLSDERVTDNDVPQFPVWTISNLLRPHVVFLALETLTAEQQSGEYNFRSLEIYVCCNDMNRWKMDWNIRYWLEWFYGLLKKTPYFQELFILSYPITLIVDTSIMVSKLKATKWLIKIKASFWNSVCLESTLYRPSGLVWGQMTKCEATFWTSLTLPRCCIPDFLHAALF